MVCGEDEDESTGMQPLLLSLPQPIAVELLLDRLAELPGRTAQAEESDAGGGQ